MFNKNIFITQWIWSFLKDFFLPSSKTIVNDQNKMAYISKNIKFIKKTKSLNNEVDSLKNNLKK